RANTASSRSRSWSRSSMHPSGSRPWCASWVEWWARGSSPSIRSASSAIPNRRIGTHREGDRRQIEGAAQRVTGYIGRSDTWRGRAPGGAGPPVPTRSAVLTPDPTARLSVAPPSSRQLGSTGLRHEDEERDRGDLPQDRKPAAAAQGGIVKEPHQRTPQEPSDP